MSIKESIKKPENLYKSIKEEKMAKKETRNLILMVFGIILILFGLISFAIFISNDKSLIIPTVVSIIGSILAIFGGLRKW